MFATIGAAFETFAWLGLFATAALVVGAATVDVPDARGSGTSIGNAASEGLGVPLDDSGARAVAAGLVPTDPATAAAGHAAPVERHQVYSRVVVDELVACADEDGGRVGVCGCEGGGLLGARVSW
jgi:hypothetical protein